MFSHQVHDSSYLTRRDDVVISHFPGCRESVPLIWFRIPSPCFDDQLLIVQLDLFVEARYHCLGLNYGVHVCHWLYQSTQHLIGGPYLKKDGPITVCERISS